MEELIKRQGKTVILVSHNLRQVERLCERAICFDKGKVSQDGLARDVCNYFYEENDRKIAEQIASRGRWESSNDIELISCELHNEKGQKISSVVHGADTSFSLTYKCLNKVENLTIVFGIHTTDFVFVGSITTGPEDVDETLEPGTYHSTLRLHNLPLSIGSFSVRIAFDIGDPQRNAFYADNIMSFKVTHSNIKKGDISNEGIILLDGHWE